MSWWCAAADTPWEWSWQPYAGVWLFAAALLAGYFQVRRRSGAPARATQGATFLAGVILVWAVADWPVGPLGAGYLLTVHTAQYLVLTLVVPPLLILGTPASSLRHLTAAPRARAIAAFFSKPATAFVWFHLVVLGTHLPPVVDELTRWQLGMFTITMAWLSSGLLFWWQVLAPLPELRPLSPPGRFLFVVISMILPTVPGAFMTFADYPIYRLFELAPRVGGIPAAVDQQIAGLLMQVGGGLAMLGIATVLFFRWSSAHEQQTGDEPIIVPHR